MVNASGHSSFAIVTVSDNWIYSWCNLLRILCNHDCRKIALSVNWKVFYTPKLMYTLAMLRFTHEHCVSLHTASVMMEDSNLNKSEICIF